MQRWLRLISGKSIGDLIRHALVVVAGAAKDVETKVARKRSDWTISTKGMVENV